MGQGKIRHRGHRPPSVRSHFIRQTFSFRFFRLKAYRDSHTADLYYSNFHLALSELYGQHPTPITLSDSIFSRISKLFEKAARYIHSRNGYDPSDIEGTPIEELINGISETLSEPLRNISVSHDIPEDLTATLQKNIFFFSGFKTHHEMEEASRLLKGEDGGFKPFSKFFEDVRKIDDTYNRNYLNAEYNFAVGSTQMAVKWHEWESDGGSFDLQYRTAGDDRVREEHADLDGTTLPMDDPFWKSYLPPNGWNCRCTAVQVPKGKYPLSDSEKAQAAGANATSKPKQQIFRFNPGAQERIFPPKHPYFPKGCGSCKYKLSYDESNPQCQACKSIAKCSMLHSDQKKASTEALSWGRANIIAKYEYTNEDIPMPVSFVRNSFTENLRKGELLFAKIDVLNNIKEYMNTEGIKWNIDLSDNHSQGAVFYKAIVPYKGDIKEGKGRKIELQCKSLQKDKCHFYFIKFL